MEISSSFNNSIIPYGLAGNIIVPTSNNLTINEIFFLNYISNKITTFNMPGYWKYEYELNTETTISKLLNLNYIELVPNLEKMTISQLKNILNKYNLNFSGKKLELIEYIKNTLSPDIIKKEVINKFSLTTTGKQLLNNNVFI